MSIRNIPITRHTKLNMLRIGKEFAKLMAGDIAVP